MLKMMDSTFIKAPFEQDPVVVLPRATVGLQEEVSLLLLVLLH